MDTSNWTLTESGRAAGAGVYGPGDRPDELPDIQTELVTYAVDVKGVSPHQRLEQMARAQKEKYKMSLSNNGSRIEFPLLSIRYALHKQSKRKPEEFEFTFFMADANEWYKAGFDFSVAFSIDVSRKTKYTNGADTLHEWYCGKIETVERIGFCWRFKLVEASRVFIESIFHPRFTTKETEHGTL